MLRDGWQAEVGVVPTYCEGLVVSWASESFSAHDRLVYIAFRFSDIVIFQPKRLHNKFEESQIRYDGTYDTDKLKKFYLTQL